jgi:hypothetical protein
MILINWVKVTIHDLRMDEAATWNTASGTVQDFKVRTQREGFSDGWNLSPKPQGKHGGSSVFSIFRETYNIWERMFGTPKGSQFMGTGPYSIFQL